MHYLDNACFHESPLYYMANGHTYLCSNGVGFTLFTIHYIINTILSKEVPKGKFTFFIRIG